VDDPSIENQREMKQGERMGACRAGRVDLLDVRVGPTRPFSSYALFNPAHSGPHPPSFFIPPLTMRSSLALACLAVLLVALMAQPTEGTLRMGRAQERASEKREDAWMQTGTPIGAWCPHVFPPRAPGGPWAGSEARRLHAHALTMQFSSGLGHEITGRAAVPARPRAIAGLGGPLGLRSSLTFSFSLSSHRPPP